MPTQRAVSIPSHLSQQRWTCLRGLQKVWSAEGLLKAGPESVRVPEAGLRERTDRASRESPNHPGCPSESREGLSHSEGGGSRHA